MLLARAREIVAKGHPNDLVTVEMLAAVALVSEDTIRRDIKKGALLAVRVGGRALRIRGNEARRYVYGCAAVRTFATN